MGKAHNGHYLTTEQAAAHLGLSPRTLERYRVNGANEAVLDYYLLPFPILDTNSIGLAEENGLMLDAFRFDTLDRFFAMARRALISELSL